MSDDIHNQINQDLDALGPAVGQQDIAEIERLLNRLGGIGNILGFQLTDFQRRRLRAEAHEIEKLGGESPKSVAGCLRRISANGLR